MEGQALALVQNLFPRFTGLASKLTKQFLFCSSSADHCIFRVGSFSSETSSGAVTSLTSGKRREVGWLFWAALVCKRHTDDKILQQFPAEWKKAWDSVYWWKCLIVSVCVIKEKLAVPTVLIFKEMTFPVMPVRTSVLSIPFTACLKTQITIYLPQFLRIFAQLSSQWSHWQFLPSPLFLSLP